MTGAAADRPDRRRRIVAVQAPDRLDPLRLAMTEDVVDLVSEMSVVAPALALPPTLAAAEADALRTLLWPGTPTVAGRAADVGSTLAALHALGADEGAVVCADAPDLPALLLGKLHSALTSAAVAVCPSDDGGLVALAARLPPPAWLTDRPLDLDATDALRTVTTLSAVAVGAGWHRVRAPGDVSRLDPDLEGWAATRRLLRSPGG